MQPNKTEKPPVAESEAERILSSVLFEQGFHFATDLGKIPFFLFDSLEVANHEIPQRFVAV